SESGEKGHRGSALARVRTGRFYCFTLSLVLFKFSSGRGSGLLTSYASQGQIYASSHVSIYYGTAFRTSQHLVAIIFVSTQHLWHVGEVFSPL
ncbi:MAG: hypothetical protein QW808_02580, partial [Desulfurococcaceae archaeon]